MNVNYKHGRSLTSAIGRAICFKTFYLFKKKSLTMVNIQWYNIHLPVGNVVGFVYLY